MLDIAQLEKVLAATGRGLTSVFEIFPDMVFIVDQEENVLFVNQVAARALGKQPGDVVGRKQAALFGQELADRHSRAIRQVFRTGKASDREMAFRHTFDSVPRVSVRRPPAVHRTPGQDWEDVAASLV